MSREHSKRRKKIARLWLSLIVLALCAAGALLWWWVWDPANPWPVLRGFLVGSNLMCVALITAVWRRLYWARYILVALLLFMGVLFMASYISAAGRGSDVKTPAGACLISATVTYLVAATVLICSRRIQYLATAPGSSGA